MTSPPLRERQAAQVRLAAIEAAIGLLESRSVDDVSMGEIAKAAGISLRTLYRYFPDRAALLRAAGEQVYGSLGIPVDIAGPREVAASFLDAAGRLSTRPALARALVRTTAGRAARSAGRPQRVEAVRTALKPLTDGLNPDTARWATAVIAHLCSAASWVSITDDSDLRDSDAQQAVAWAIDTLVAALRETREGTRGRPSPSDPRP